MSRIHGSKTKVYVNGVDISSYITSAQSNNAVESSDSSALGNTDRSYMPGLQSGAITFAGFFDNTAGTAGLDSLFLGLEQAATDPIVSVVRTPDINGLGDSGRADQLSKYSKTSPIAGIVAIALDFQPSGGFDEVRTVAPVGTLTPSASAGTTAQYNGGTATALGAVGYIQAIGVPAGTPVVKIQHSTNGSTSWSDLITFASITAAQAPQAQVAVVAGTVRPFLQAIVTGGSVNCWIGVSQPVA